MVFLYDVIQEKGKRQRGTLCVLRSRMSSSVLPLWWEERPTQIPEGSDPDRVCCRLVAGRIPLVELRGKPSNKRQLVSHQPDSMVPSRGIATIGTIQARGIALHTVAFYLPTDPDILLGQPGNSCSASFAHVAPAMMRPDALAEMLRDADIEHGVRLFYEDIDRAEFRQARKVCNGDLGEVHEHRRDTRQRGLHLRFPAEAECGCLCFWCLPLVSQVAAASAQ